MQFPKAYYYADELMNEVTNKVNISISNTTSGKIELSNAPLHYCEQCNFPLLDLHCRFCHFKNAER